MKKTHPTKRWKPNKKSAKPYGDVFAKGGGKATGGPRGRKQPSLPRFTFPEEDFIDDEPEFIPPYRAIPCSCGHRACKNWFVDPVAAVQCVSFTQEQAEAVAKLLNEMEGYKR